MSFFTSVCVFFYNQTSSLPPSPPSVRPSSHVSSSGSNKAGPLASLYLSLFPAALHLPFFSSTSPSRPDTGIVYLISVCTADGATRNLSSFIPSARLGGERRTFTLIHRQINTHKWTNCDTSERLHTSTRLSALSGSDVEVKCGKEATGSRM